MRLPRLWFTAGRQLKTNTYVRYSENIPSKTLVFGRSKCQKQHASQCAYIYSYIVKCVQSYFNTPIHTCFVGDQNIISKISGLSFFLRLFFLYLILSSAGRFIERGTILKPSTHAMWNLTCDTPVKCPY